MDKEKYIIPVIEIINITGNDIICTSDPFEHNPGSEDPGFDPWADW